MQNDNEDRHILVVDDDARLRRLLQRYLKEQGYRVSTAADVGEARAQLRVFAFDLLVLDVMLPDGDGIDLTSEIRGAHDFPILLLTARGETEDRISGLEAGADDYLVKPFEPRELLLRIATILRRVRQPIEIGPVRFGPYTLDMERRELRCEDEVMHLTTGELSLLSILAQQSGEPISRAELAERSRISGTDRAVDVQIARLRRKLEDDPRQPRYLLTIRGEGYVLRAGGGS